MAGSGVSNGSNGGSGSNVTALFRASTAHSPSYFTLDRAGGGAAGEIVDFCIPCNPYFPTPTMFDRLAGSLREILTYYPSGADTITAELCRLLGLNPQTVAMGNGSTELITWIDHLLVRESLAVPVPTFGRWTDQPTETGKRVDMLLLPEARGFALDPASFVQFVRTRGSRVAVVCNPNNPDGGLLPKQQVLSLLDQLQDLDLVVVDESFLEFADAGQETSVAAEAVLRTNVIVLRSLGKNFGLHGVRFGYLVSNPGLAGEVRAALPKWNLNSFAETVVFMLKEYRQEYAESLSRVCGDRQAMIWRLSQLPGLTVYPSQGNFVYVRLPEGADGAVLRDRLLAEHGVLVRECGNKIGSSSRFVRLVVRPEQDVERLLTAMEQVLYGGLARSARAPAPAPEPPQPMLAQIPAQPQQPRAQPLPQAQARQPAPAPMLAQAPSQPLPQQNPPLALAHEPTARQPLAARGLAPAQAARPGATAGAPAAGYTSGTAAVDRLIAQA
ncbi:aminotransferase class I/II-fold pyridoxal phosphate-dependent enzyme [Streptomyces peucetius]|uniref:Aminotransferase class I/II-fold pyridoxal phosphate-dependent enzyme n=1 Tax=Streptomyces peucetius TaxID=1950 RepID=A0ABY6IE66_STRPE|nr:aminotransferase class I/II-fold pyridoxal phosphate-dependent enzyme [Streptomyces peucetius]UYQ65268.1 aminotransferase class I/II-fold pyridoxal phosphate-dependent enzyme [Streptomyces peucetius]